MPLTVGARRGNDGTNTPAHGTSTIEMPNSVKDKIRLCESSNTDSSFDNIAQSIVGPSPG
jgi:hypothetical protein